LLQRLELADKSAPILRALDKLAKIGRDKVAEEMQTSASMTASQADAVLKLAEIEGSNEQVLRQLEPLVAGSEAGQAGVARLAEVVSAVRAAGVPAERLALDVSIARGLDYYTGMVFETFLDKLPTIGSVCSGGRYDNLAGLYTTQQLPGIGASLGLDRLLAAMEELGMIPKTATPAEVFLAYFDAARLHDYLRLAAELRTAGLGVEFFPEPRKLGQQLKYADRRGFPIALVAGENEFAARTCQIKHLPSGKTEEASLDNVDELVETIRRLLL
jgi:histidyl-tRNA synthetase